MYQSYFNMVISSSSDDNLNSISWLSYQKFVVYEYFVFYFGISLFLIIFLFLFIKKLKTNKKC